MTGQQTGQQAAEAAEQQVTEQQTTEQQAAGPAGRQPAGPAAQRPTRPSAPAPLPASGDVAPGAVIESATWPPVRVVEVDGLLVGLSRGFTRRANSVIVADPTTAAVTDPAATVDRVERHYREDGGIARFRLSSADELTPLGAELRERGYQPAAATGVMVVGGLAGRTAAPSVQASGEVARLVVSDQPDQTWLDGWLQVKAAGKPEVVGTARDLLTGAPARYLTLVTSEPVAVARVCRQGEWAGIACLTVAPDHRRRGWGTAVSLAALDVAADLGAARAFLQVERSNLGAAMLYRQLGFVAVDGYTYWEQPAG